MHTLFIRSFPQWITVLYASGDVEPSLPFALYCAWVLLTCSAYGVPKNTLSFLPPFPHHSMMFTRKHYIIGAALLAALLIIPLAASEFKYSPTTALQQEVKTWGKEYADKSQQKIALDQQSKQLEDDLRGLACKALSNRIALCQRGMDDYCAQEKESRAALIAGFGATFETVCSKDFQKQGTAL